MIPEMLEKLDYGLISFHPAFEIAFLKPNEQRMLLDAMDYAQSAPSVSQAQRIKKLSHMNKLTLEAISSIVGTTSNYLQNNFRDNHKDRITQDSET